MFAVLQRKNDKTAKFRKLEGSRGGGPNSVFTSGKKSRSGSWDCQYTIPTNRYNWAEQKHCKRKHCK